MPTSLARHASFFLLGLVSVLLLGSGCQSGAPAMEDAAASGMPSYNTHAMARAVHEQVNAERTARDLQPLAWSEALARLARAHSQDMVARDFFAHTNPDGQSPTDRGRAREVRCTAIVENRPMRGIAENIYDAAAYHSRRTTQRGDEVSVTYDWKSADELAATVVQGWMDSPGHRRNILDERYQAQGLGVVVSDDLRVLVTQNFC